MISLLSSYTSASEFRERCLQFHPLPMVSVGIDLDGIPSVVLNNSTGLYNAVSHLIDVHHFTRIAFLSGPKEHPDTIERFTAFVRAMESHGLPVDETLLLQGNFIQASGNTTVRELLDTRGKIPGEDVRAIVCCNDYMASGVMLELDKRDIRIPGEIAIIGFDDIPFGECLTPSLASVHNYFDTMATKATEMMIMLLEGKSVPEVVSIDSTFIPRRSRGCQETEHNNYNLPLPKDMKKLLNIAPQKFLTYLNPEIIDADDHTLTVWKQPLVYLRQKDTWDKRSGAKDSVENFDQKSHNFLGGTVYNTFYSLSYQNMIYDMGSSLTATMEISQLLSILTKILPGAGIGRCCICLYENPENSPDLLPPWSRLILAFSQSKQWELPPGGLRFATKKLLPDEIVEKQGGWKSWVVIALYFGEEQRGYVLMDSDAPYENIYWNLRKQISGTLKGDRLLNETRKAYNLLMEVNEQKTQFFINVAHETKTPLTLIKNYLELYLEQHPMDENLSVIKQNIDMLLDNMLNFLDVEKLQKGGAVLYC